MNIHLPRTPNMFGAACLLALFLTAILCFSPAAQATTAVSTNEAQTAAPYAPQEQVLLALKLDPARINWVFVQAPNSFPGLRFARPNEAFVQQTGRYVALFSADGRPMPGAGSLYYTEPGGPPRVEFILGDLENAGEVVVSSARGPAPESLENVQTITLLAPYSDPYFNAIQEDVERLFDEAKDVGDDIEDIFDDLF